MPSKTKKQLNFFKLVKSFVDNGLRGLETEKRNLNIKRNFSELEIEKIIKISKTINYADLEDLTSGVVGDNSFGEKRDFKVGYWIKFETEFKSGPQPEDIKKGVFIVKITRTIPENKRIEFNFRDIYNKNAIKTSPLRRVDATVTENIWIDSVNYSKILETAKTKEELVENKNINEIRKIIQEILSEMNFKF